MTEFRRTRRWTKEHGWEPIEFKDLRAGDLFVLNEVSGKLADHGRVLDTPKEIEPPGTWIVKVERRVGIPETMLVDKVWLGEE